MPSKRQAHVTFDDEVWTILQSYASTLDVPVAEAVRVLCGQGLARQDGQSRSDHTVEQEVVKHLLGALSDYLEKLERTDAPTATGLAVGGAVALTRFATQRAIAYGSDDAGVSRPAVETISAALADIGASDDARARRCAQNIAKGVASFAKGGTGARVVA
jgi:hypothetical protein